MHEKRGETSGSDPSFVLTLFSRCHICAAQLFA